MERQKINLKKLIIFALAIFYLVGIFIHLFFRSSEFLKILTPLFLMLTSAAVFFEDRPSKKFLIWFLVGYFFTLFIEIVGVKTGLIFGPYKYGENLGIKFYGVPLVIGLNWVVLIIAAIGFVENIKTSNYLKSFFVGLIMLLYDLILEIEAPELNYWFFERGEVPIQNFISWFIISFALSYFYFHFQIKRSLVIARFNLLFQFIFFLVLLFF